MICLLYIYNLIFLMCPMQLNIHATYCSRKECSLMKRIVMRALKGFLAIIGIIVIYIITVFIEKKDR